MPLAKSNQWQTAYFNVTVTIFTAVLQVSADSQKSDLESYIHEALTEASVYEWVCICVWACEHTCTHVPYLVEVFKSQF